MKNLFMLSEEDRNRILNLHETATKRQYLGEQPISQYSTQPVAPMDNTRVTSTQLTSPEGRVASGGKASGKFAGKPKTQNTSYTDIYVKQAQELLGVTVDGKFGPNTLEVLKKKLSSTPPSGTPQTGTPTSGTPQTGTPTSGTPQTGTPPSGTPPPLGGEINSMSDDWAKG
jgi:hypothetical protein